jgi:hypothetical protein
MRDISIALMFLLSVATAAVGANNPITGENVIVDGANTADYNITVQRALLSPYYWYIYYQSGNDKIFARRSTNPDHPEGPYNSAVQITPNTHSFAGNECAGSQNNVYGIGGVIPEMFVIGERVLMTLNHACDVDTDQHEFYYIFVSGTTRSGSVAIPFLKSNVIDIIMWDPVPFRVNNGVFGKNAVFGFLFMFDAGHGWQVGYGFRDTKTNVTTLAAWDGTGSPSNQSNSNYWTWVEVGAGDDWEIPYGYIPAAIGGVGGQINQAEMISLTYQATEPKGMAHLLVFPTGPFGNDTCPLDWFKLRELRFNTSNYHVTTTAIGGTIYTYTGIDYLGPCAYSRKCAAYPTRTKSWPAYQDEIFWAEDGDASVCNYSYRLLHGTAASP